MDTPCIWIINFADSDKIGEIRKRLYYQLSYLSITIIFTKFCFLDRPLNPQLYDKFTYNYKKLITVLLHM